MRALICMLAFCVGTAGAASESTNSEHATQSPDLDIGEAPAGPAVPELGTGNCPGMAARARSTRLDRALAGGYGVQYWGENYTAEGLAAQPHGLLIIEAAKVGALYSESGREVFFSPEEVEQISRDGTRPVLGYLNVGELENYRDYWIEFAAARGYSGASKLPEWFGPHHGHGDHLAAYWVPEWRDLLFARVDRLMESGAEGVFLDDVLQYYSHAADQNLVWPGGRRAEGPTTAPELARAMMQLVVDIADRVRAWDCEAFVVVNNAAFIGRDAAESAEGDGSSPIFEAYLSAIDAIMIENLFAPGTHPNTLKAVNEDFNDNGIKVMALEVVSRYNTSDADALRLKISQMAQESGFVAYIADDDAFNRLSSPIPPEEKS